MTAKWVIIIAIVLNRLGGDRRLKIYPLISVLFGVGKRDYKEGKSMKSFLTNMLVATVILLLFAIGSLITIDAGLSADEIVPHYADTELAKAGLKAYNEAGCANCHSFFGQQGQVGGPRLNWVGERYSQEMLENIIRNPRDFYSDTIMPPIHNRFSDAEIALIAEYLASFKRD